MADPSAATMREVDAIRSSTLNTEQKITKLIALQNDLLKAQAANASLRNDNLKATTAQIDAILKSQGVASSGTTANNNYATSANNVGTSSTRAASNVGSFSDSLRKALEGTNIVVGQMAVYQEQLENLSAPHVELAMQMKNLAGGSLALYRAVGDSPGGAAQGIKDYYTRLGDTTTLKNATDAQIQLLENVNKGNGIFKSAGDIIPALMKGMTGFGKETEEAAFKAIPAFNAQGMSLKEIMGGSQFVLEGFAHVLNDVQLGMTFIADQAGKTGMQIAEDLARVDFAIKAYGISNSDVTEMIRLNYVKTGKANTDYFHEVTKAAEIADQAYGIAADEIVADTIKMSNNIQMFGFRAPDEFARISKAARDSHASIEDLTAIMGKFDTFENAATAVGDLNATLGTNFDSIELMTLKYTDPVKMIDKLREGFRATGKSFEEMFMSPERLPFLTSTLSTLSMSTETLRSLFTDATSSSEIVRQQAEAAQKVKDAEMDTDELMKTRIVQVNAAAKDVSDMTKRLDEAAQLMAGSSRTIVKASQDVNTQILQLSNQVIKEFAPEQEKLIKKAAKSYETIIDSVVQALNTKLRQAGDIVADLVRETEAAIKRLEDAARLGKTVPGGGSTSPGTPSATQAPDLALSPGAPTKVSRRFGEFFEEYLLDPRDAVIAGPPKMFDDILLQAKAMKEVVERSRSAAIETTPSPPTPSPASTPTPAAPTLPAQLAARMQPIGTDLNITIDGTAFIQYIMATMAKEYPV